MTSSIEVNLAIPGDVVLNDRYQHFPALHDSVEKEIEWCDGEREASCRWIIFKIVVRPLFLESFSPRKQFGSGIFRSSARSRTIPNSGKVRFAIRSARCRTFGRLWFVEKQPAEICPVLSECIQGNEIADRNVGALGLTGLDHNDIFVLIPFEPHGSRRQLVPSRRQLRERVVSRPVAAGLVRHARLHILSLYRCTGYW